MLEEMTRNVRRYSQMKSSGKRDTREQRKDVLEVQWSGDFDRCQKGC